MRHLWLHGFASGPTSSKGQFVRDRRHLDGLGARADNEQDPDRL